MLSLELKSQIKQEALRNIPLEICGLITRNKDNTSLSFCKNISSSPKNHFELSPHDYLKSIKDKDTNIIGVFHSQENENPSILDILNSIGHKYYSIVYSWKADKFFEVTDSHFKYKQYIGKNFEIGKQDCLSLVRDFYKNEYGILINNYSRTDNWYKDNPNLIKESYEREGFIEVDNINDLKEGDILVFTGHLGIYLEKDLLLHHGRGKISNIEHFSDTWKKLVSKIYRHKSLVS